MVRPLQDPAAPLVGLNGVRAELKPLVQASVCRFVAQEVYVGAAQSFEDKRRFRVALLNGVDELRCNVIYLTRLNAQEQELQLHRLGSFAVQLEAAVEVCFGGT